MGEGWFLRWMRRTEQDDRLGRWEWGWGFGFGRWRVRRAREFVPRAAHRWAIHVTPVAQLFGWVMELQGCGARAPTAWKPWAWGE